MLAFNRARLWRAVPVGYRSVLGQLARHFGTSRRARTATSSEKWPLARKRRGKHAELSALLGNTIVACERPLSRLGAGFFSTVAYLVKTGGGVVYFSRSMDRRGPFLFPTLKGSGFGKWPLRVTPQKVKVSSLIGPLVIWALQPGDPDEVPPSTGQSLDGAKQVFVRGVRVDHCRLEGRVPGEPLRQTDVLGAPVDVRASGVTQAVEVEPALKPCALLPNLEEAPQLPQGKTTSQTADKERRFEGPGATVPSSCPQQFIELGAQVVRQDHLLHRGLLASALVDTEFHVSLGTLPVLADVAQVERDNFVLAQSGGDRQADDDVIAKAIAMQAGHAEQFDQLKFSEGASRALDVVGVVRHRNPYRLIPRTVSRMFAADIGGETPCSL